MGGFRENRRALPALSRHYFRHTKEWNGRTCTLGFFYLNGEKGRHDAWRVFSWRQILLHDSNSKNGSSQVINLQVNQVSKLGLFMLLERMCLARSFARGTLAGIGCERTPYQLLLFCPMVPNCERVPTSILNYVTLSRGHGGCLSKTI